MYLKTKILFVLFIILSFVLGTKDVYGAVCFSDNFDQNNLDNWIFVAGGSAQESWRIDNRRLLGEVYYQGYSFLLSKSFWNLSNYSMEFDSINEGGVDQSVVFRISENRDKYYLLNIRFNDPYWPQDGGEIVLWKYSIIDGYKRLFTFNNLNLIELTQYKVHKIKIETNESDIKVYFDSILIIDFDDVDNPILTGGFGFYNWGGQYYERPTRNLFDNFTIGDFNCSEIGSLIPKIIIIPGFGASWNSEAIVYNNNVSNNQWKMTPFVKNYDGLIDALKQNNLKENEDYYVWNYDWRKPLKDIVVDLDSFIDQKIGNNEKVILIGHSLGGLTARIWAEDNKNDFRLDKVIALGSPNLGSVDSYAAWNGGQISDLSKFSSIAFKILLELKGLTTKTNMEAVRTYIPSVKDLLPTFNFIKKEGVFLSNDKLETKNDYLENKNNSNINSEINLKLFVGNGFKTIDSINLKKNNIFDKVLGIWPDGRINNFIYTDSGDGTVLVKSANYGKNNFVEFDSNHGDIIDKTINQVMMEVGLSQVDVAGKSEDYRNNLVFFVGSPVRYSVKCDNNSPVLENDGFVVIKNKNYKICTINMIGTGDGLVHVVSGNTNNSNWSYLEKNIKNGEINFIKIDPKNGQIVDDKNNILFLKSIIREDINSLLILNKNNKDLREALKSLDKNQPKQLIKNMFDFREKNEDRKISQKIIDNATIWLSFLNKCSKNEALNDFKTVSNYRDLIESLISNRKNLKIDVNMAVDYQKIIDLLEINQKEIKNNNYNKICGRNFLILNYGKGIRKWLLEDSDL